MANPRILIVRNDDSAAESLEDCLQDLGYGVCSAWTGRQAIEEAEARRPDLALIDLELEGEVDGVEVARRLGSRFDVPVVYLTDDVEGSRFQRSQATGPFGYVLKPFEKRQLHLNLRTALAQHESKSRLDGTIDDLSIQVQFMKTILDSIGDGVMVADEKGKYFLLNSTAQQIFDQYSRGPDIEMNRRPQVYGLYHLDKETLFSPEDLPLARVLRGDPATDVELFVRNAMTPPEGVYFSASAQSLQLGNGGTGGVVIFRDVTRLKRTELELQKTVDKLQGQTHLMETVYEHMTDGVFVADAEGRILFNNSSAERILGVDGTNMALDDWTEKYQAFLPDKSIEVPVEKLPLLRALKGERVDNLELFIRNENKPDGVFVRISSQPLWNQKSCDVQAAVSVIHDITERKETDLRLQKVVTDLRKQTRLMEAVLDSMNEGVVVADATGRILLANRQTWEILGKEATDSNPDEWSQQYGVFLLDQKTCVPSRQVPLARALRGEVVEEENLFVRNEKIPDGVYVTGSACPLWTDEGEQTAVAVFRDVTKQRLAEIKLEHTIDDLSRQTQLMETVFNSISDGVVVADGEGRFTIFNPGAERIVGIGGLDIPFDQWTDKYGLFFTDKKTPIPPDQLPLVRAMHGESVDAMEMFVRNEQRPDGVFLSVSGRPLTRNVGGHGGGVVVFQNITERKEAEVRLRETMRKIREQGELMEATFKSISDGIVVADAAGQFLYVNPAAEEIVGMSASDEDLEKWSETYGTFYPDRETPVQSEDLPLIRAIFGGTSTDDEDLFIRNRQRPSGVFIRVSARPLLNQIGGVRGGVIVFRDVTAHMMAEEALVRAFAQGRLEIVDTILHNIGNAINSVTIGIDTVYRELTNDPLVRRLAAVADGIDAHREDLIGYVRDDPQGRRLLPFVHALARDFSRQRETLVKTVDRVRDRAMHIADIVRNQRLLDNSTMSRKYINLADAVSAAVKVLQDSIAKRGIEVDIDCKRAPSEIRTQESRFHQMLVNLIKNSIEAIDSHVETGEFHGRPRIRIRAYVKGEFFHLDVADNGIGIDVGKVNPKLIFAPGYTTKESGSGLGLHSIANFIIGSGGEIHPLSDGIGQGATMRVRLRLSSVSPEDGRA